MFSIVIYTHSDYFDILPIQLEYFEKLVSTRVYLLSDQPYPDCKYETILYDSAKPYASRLLSLQEIQDEYIIFTHENDVLVRFNECFIEDIIRVMRQYGIDSVELKHDARGSDTIPIHANLSLLKKTEYFYNVQPTLWRRESLIQILRAFPSKPYRAIEGDDLQKYMVENYKTYTLYSEERLRSIWYELPVGYCYIHMTSRLMLLPCKKENNLDPALQAEHEQIFARHLQKSIRRIQEHLYAYDNSLVETSI